MGWAPGCPREQRGHVDVGRQSFEHCADAPLSTAAAAPSGQGYGLDEVEADRGHPSRVPHGEVILPAPVEPNCRVGVAVRVAARRHEPAAAEGLHGLNPEGTRATECGHPRDALARSAGRSGLAVAGRTWPTSPPPGRSVVGPVGERRHRALVAVQIVGEAPVSVTARLDAEILNDLIENHTALTSRRPEQAVMDLRVGKWLTSCRQTRRFRARFVTHVERTHSALRGRGARLIRAMPTPHPRVAEAPPPRTQPMPCAGDWLVGGFGVRGADGLGFG